ncbi:hypothetical protein FO519_005420 [Halicephalobus sp. NKZ332]|nr:hypothetical protein FO519_005420 [Halicephalobus sp. NKZ332]
MNSFRLASNGHNITILNVDMKPAGELGENITVIDIIDKPIEAAAEQFEALLFTITAHSYVVPLAGLYNGFEFENLVLKRPNLFSKIFETNYNLIIVDEFFSIHGMVSASFLNSFYGTPYFVFSATQTNTFFRSNLALGKNFGSHLSLFTGIPSSEEDVFNPKNFFHRFFNFLEAGTEDFFVNKVIVNFLPGPRIFGLKNFDFFTFAERSSGVLSDHFDRIGEINTGECRFY